MKLTDLIQLARGQDPGFRMSYDYRVNVRKKVPDFDWLMKGLELALGKDFVRNAAQEEVDRMSEDANDGHLSEEEI